MLGLWPIIALCGSFFNTPCSGITPDPEPSRPPANLFLLVDRQRTPALHIFLETQGLDGYSEVARFLSLWELGHRLLPYQECLLLLIRSSGMLLIVQTHTCTKIHTKFHFENLKIALCNLSSHVYYTEKCRGREAM